MFSNVRTWSHYSTPGIIQDCRHQQASSTFSPPVRNEAKKEKKAGSSLTPPPSPYCPECAAALQTPHSNAIEVARSSSCSSASSTRGCETESAPEMLADAPIGNRGARQWAALVLVGAPWCRSWAHSGTSKLSGRVGRDLVGRATTWTRGDPDKVTRPTSAELENLLRILIEYKGSAFQKFYSRKKNLLISMVCQFWRSRFFSKIS